MVCRGSLDAVVTIKKIKLNAYLNVTCVNITEQLNMLVPKLNSIIMKYKKRLHEQLLHS